MCCDKELNVYIIIIYSCVLMYPSKHYYMNIIVYVQVSSLHMAKKWFCHFHKEFLLNSILCNLVQNATFNFVI